MKHAIRKNTKADGSNPLPHENGELIAVFKDYPTAKEFLEMAYSFYNAKGEAGCFPYHITSYDE